MAGESYPSRYSLLISSVCSPSKGGGLRMDAGVPENFQGIPSNRNSPIV